MIYLLVSFLGCVCGYLIGMFTQEELKPGLVYLKVFGFIVLAGIIFGFSYSSFNIFLFFIGIIAGLLLKFEYFYFGLGLISAGSFLNNALVFVYGLPYGSLAFYNKKKILLVYSSIFFAVSLMSYFLNYNFVSFAGGGLIGVLLFKLWQIFH